MKIECLVTGPLEVNTYIIYDTQHNDCIVIDPADADMVTEYLNANELRCTHILLTHGHFDHLLGVAQLQRELGAKVCIHEEDKEALQSDKVNHSVFLMQTSVEHCLPDILLHDGDVLDFPSIGVTINVMHTPGHSRGCVCFIIESERVIFSGDTLFRLSVGRVDLLGADMETLFDSLQNKLYALEGDYRVLPGHMRETTLEFERNHNTIVRKSRL